MQHELDRNQDLLARVKKLEGREFEADKNLSDQVEENQVLRRNLEAVNKKLEERDTKLNTANKVPAQTHTYLSLQECLSSYIQSFLQSVSRP